VLGRLHHLRRPAWLLAGGLALVAAAVAAIMLIDESGRSVTDEFGLTSERPFAARLGGSLYAARSLRDAEGAPDLAYLTEDVPLDVRVQGQDGSGVAGVALFVDGHLAGRRVAPCGGGCPARFSVRFAPAVVARGAGRHQLRVTANGPGGTPSATVARFEVNVGDVGAAAVEIEPRAAATAAPMTHQNARADAIARSAAAHGALAKLLGGSRLTLRDSGSGSGAVTVVADVIPARRAVTATLPQFDQPEQARMTAATLSDLVLDVDVPHSRVVGIQPGPGSHVTAWSLTKPAGPSEDERLSSAFTPRRPPRLLRLSDSGPAFFTQDGDPTLEGSARDWPVSLLFTGNATIAKVKAGMRQLGLVRRGHSRFLGYRTAGDVIRFDGDRGLKTACDANATDLHVRLYAPTATDTFVDSKLGHVVVATVHLDHRDGCGAGPQQFGFSERAERALARLIGRLGWRVTIDQYSLGNQEPLRRDTADPSHIWQSDGLATGVVVS
jgi:hypothetical protein